MDTSFTSASTLSFTPTPSSTPTPPSTPTIPAVARVGEVGSTKSKRKRCRPDECPQQPNKKCKTIVYNQHLIDLRHVWLIIIKFLIHSQKAREYGFGRPLDATCKFMASLVRQAKTEIPAGFQQCEYCHHFCDSQCSWYIGRRMGGGVKATPSTGNPTWSIDLFVCEACKNYLIKNMDALKEWIPHEPSVDIDEGDRIIWHDDPFWEPKDWV